MENKDKESKEIATLREYYAIEILKTFLADQGRNPQMTLWHRIKCWFGKGGWRKNYQYNFEDCAKKSFEMADYMLKAR